MFFDKLKFSIKKGPSSEAAESGVESGPGRVAGFLSGIARSTWVSELRTLASVVTRRRALPIYGIDIGSTSVKILRLSGEGQELEIAALAVAALPENAIVDGEVADREAVVDAIEEAMAEHEMEPGYGIAGLSGRAVIVKKISMERTDADLARETLSYDAAEHIPFEPGEVCLDLHILDSAPEAETMDVLLVAAKRPLVEVQSEILRAAGLIPAAIDVDTFALANAYLVNYEPSDEENVGILNVGNYVTNVVVIQGGIPWVMRDLAIGTNTFVEGVQAALSTEKDRARDILFGSPERGESQLTDVVVEVGGELVSEIERSLAYADSSGGGGLLTRMILSGGGCRVAGLKELLAERFQIPVEIADPFQKFSWGDEVLMETPPEEIAPRFMVATGLALRGVQT